MDFEIVPSASLSYTDQDWTARLETLTVDAGADGLVILPDMVYPYHPSTGMIVDPRIVEWLVETVEKRTSLSAEVCSLLYATSGEVDPQLVASLLGYDTLARELGLDSVSVPESFVEDPKMVAADGGTGTVEALSDRPVITVLSPRFAADGETPIDHERFFDELAFDGINRLRERVAFGVLDATYLNCGRTYRADRVFLGEPGQVDELVEALFGSSSTEAFDKSEVESIANDLDVCKYSSGGVGDAIMGLGYRTYAKLSGDVVPPQMEEN